MNWTANPAGLCSRLEVKQHVILMLISFLIFWYSFNSKFNTFIINFLLYSSLFFIHLIQNLMNTSFNLSIIFLYFFIIDSTKNHLNCFIVYFYLIMLIGTWVACENHKFITKRNRKIRRERIEITGQISTWSDLKRDGSILGKIFDVSVLDLWQIHPESCEDSLFFPEETIKSWRKRAVTEFRDPGRV